MYNRQQIKSLHFKEAALFLENRENVDHNKWCGLLILAFSKRSCSLTTFDDKYKLVVKNINVFMTRSFFFCKKWLWKKRVMMTFLGFFFSRKWHCGEWPWDKDVHYTSRKWPNTVDQMHQQHRCPYATIKVDHLRCGRHKDKEQSKNSSHLWLSCAPCWVMTPSNCLRMDTRWCWLRRPLCPAWHAGRNQSVGDRLGQKFSCETTSSFVTKHIWKTTDFFIGAKTNGWHFDYNRTNISFNPLYQKRLQIFAMIFPPLFQGPFGWTKIASFYRIICHSKHAFFSPRKNSRSSSVLMDKFSS